MALLDHKYLALIMTDGSTLYAPVGLSMSCADRPTVEAAQALVSQAKPASFVPAGYNLVPAGCDIITGGGGDTPGDDNPLLSTDISPEDHVDFQQAP